ncbi:hypothetical protein ACFYS8_19935 [Kitasatospora sp. NPDC004615]|uniref:hypothetical protein n=1 Tax=unclassified Kitasatospora TaxID=2633591 RepID=UPI0036897637
MVVLISMALAITPLSGCSTTQSLSCGGSGAQLQKLEEIPILGAMPPGSSVPNEPTEPDPLGYSNNESECVDGDSGKPWIYASHTYAHPGPRAEILSYYKKAASEAGWTLGENVTGTPEDVAGICLTKKIDGRSAQLTIDFKVRSGYQPEAGAYRVQVGSNLDGSPLHCY